MTAQAAPALQPAPHDQPDFTQHLSTYHAIVASAKQSPHKTAISFFLSAQNYRQAKHISYQHLLQQINAMANFLDGLGLKDDDVVAFILPNLPETHYVLWGAQARCRAFAVNPLLEAEQIQALLEHSGAKLVVTMNPMIKLDMWEKVSSIAANLTTVKHLVGIDIAQHMDGVQGWVAKAIQWHKRRAIQMPNGLRYHNLSQVLAKQNTQQLNFVRQLNHDSVSSMFCTGGTTGLPKIALRTHGNELANTQGVALANESRMGPDSVILGGLPIFHVNGALATGLLPFAMGASVVICTPQGYRGEGVFPNFWDILAHYKVTTFSGVPTVYSTLLDYPKKDQDLSALEFCICGAAPMPVQIFKDFEAMSGAAIVEGYGLTEGTCVSSLNPVDGVRKVGSIGRALPNQNMMVAQLTDDNRVEKVCAMDEVGCLLIKGPNVFKGYLLEHQNKDIWVQDAHGNTWLNTGDLARVDDDGYYWLAGRKKELIVRGGHNIEPRIIEEAMCQHEAVHLAAAVGKPDEHAGEVPVCYVQVSESAIHDDALKAELMDFAKQTIPERAAIPKAIYLLKELPLTAVGKVFKPALEMQEIENVAKQILQQHISDQQFEFQVMQDSKKGLLAIIELNSVSDDQRKAIELSLGKYVFKTEIRQGKDLDSL